MSSQDEFDLTFEDDSPEEFWSYTQLRDWIMQLNVSHAAFRLYCILRSMLSDGKQRRTNRTRRLTHDELCWLASTANKGKPVSVSALKGWLRELEDANLIRPDGDRLVTSTGRGGITTHARGYRIASLPPKDFAGGWRNAWDKLEAYRKDWRTNPPVAPGQIASQNSDARTEPTPTSKTPGQIEGQNSDEYRQNSDGHRQNPAGRSQNSAGGKPVTCGDAPSNKTDQEASLSGAGERRADVRRETNASRRGTPVPQQRHPAPGQEAEGLEAVAMTIVSAYIEGAKDAGCPTTSRVLRGLHSEALELVASRSDQPFIDHLARLAAELPGKGWWKLTPHLLKNPMPKLSDGQGSRMTRAEQIAACSECDEYGQIETPDGAVANCRHRQLAQRSAA